MPLRARAGLGGVGRERKPESTNYAPASIEDYAERNAAQREFWEGMNRDLSSSLALDAA